MNEKIFAHNICAECGGKCCKYCGCILAPSDISFPLRYNKLLKKLRSGKYSFCLSMFYDSDGHVGYQLRLRARNVDREIVDLFSTPNTCMHWNANRGCTTFTDATRPFGGKHLIPVPSHDCKPDFKSYELFDFWAKYQEDMRQAFCEFSYNGWSVPEILYKQYQENIDTVRALAETDKAEKRFLSAVEDFLKQEGYNI